MRPANRVDDSARSRDVYAYMRKRKRGTKKKARRGKENITSGSGERASARGIIFTSVPGCNGGRGAL